MLAPSLHCLLYCEPCTGYNWGSVRVHLIGMHAWSWLWTLTVLDCCYCYRYVPQVQYVSLKKVWLQKLGLLVELIWSKLGYSSCNFYIGKSGLWLRWQNHQWKKNPFWRSYNWMSIIIIKWRFSARKSGREKIWTSFLKKLDVISQNSTSFLKTRRYLSNLDVFSQNSRHL